MSSSKLLSLFVLLGLGTATLAMTAPDPVADDGMRRGAPALQSIGAMTFGPENVLFVGDNRAGAVHAIEITGDVPRPEDLGPIEIMGIDSRIAQMLGTARDDITIHDMAVHPLSRDVYLTVTRGRGVNAYPLLLRATRDADRPVQEVRLENVRYATRPIANAPQSDPSARRDPRMFTITDLAWFDGQVYIAGLSNEEFSSALRRMSFPAGGEMRTTTLEIYHVSHGRNETQAPIMTFLPVEIQGAPYVLAAYTCTPLVSFPLGSLGDGDHVFGRTVAELGAGNQPLDMIAYQRDGQQHILIANSRHPLMRVATSDVANAPALVSPTKDEGIPRVAIQTSGIRQLADLDADHVVVLQAGADGALDLRTLPKSSF